MEPVTRAPVRTMAVSPRALPVTTPLLPSDHSKPVLRTGPVAAVAAETSPVIWIEAPRSRLLNAVITSLGQLGPVIQAFGSTTLLEPSCTPTPRPIFTSLATNLPTDCEPARS